MVVVRKGDGSLRLCVDYRRLNELTKKDKYALPGVDDTLDALQNAKYFSSLDLKCGYYQVPIREEDRKKTAVISHSGLYEFNVMPFGLVNAPATFQRAMDCVLAGLV